jgi:hypothetical protein
MMVASVSHDRHLELVYSQDPLPASRFGAQGRPMRPTLVDHTGYRKTMEQENCRFEKTEILAHNIGYMKLNSFPDPSICRPAAVTAMASLDHVDAIVFRFAYNRSGEPEMVALMAANSSTVRSIGTTPGRIRHRAPGRSHLFQETDWWTSRYMS